MFDEQNDYGGLETVFIKDEIARCEDIQDLKEIVFPKIRTQQDEWSHKVNDIIKEKGYTKSKFAELCGVSRVSVDKWCKGAIPKNRETFLRIGMAAGYSLEKMNQLLQRYGRYPALYSKSLEDCVCIYVIGNNYGDKTIEKYQFILNKIKENIIRDDSSDEVENVTTEKFDVKLSEVQGEDELEQFISDNIAMFSNAYHKFYAYVKMNIAANYMDPAYADAVLDVKADFTTGELDCSTWSGVNGTDLWSYYNDISEADAQALTTDLVRQYEADDYTEVVPLQ